MREEKDDFWNIAALLPRHKKASTNVSVGEISLPEVTEVHPPVPNSIQTAKQPDRAIPTSGGKICAAYTPKDNPLISEVRVFERKSHMHLFHGFKTMGALWQEKRGVPVPYVPFFSFVPQYEQLNRAQAAYYLYFREEVNSGNYPDVSQSYVLLYIFEILNLPDLIPPKIGILRLANLWAAYRKKMPMLDKNLIPWLADYGLLHGVPCPREILSPFLDEILAKAPMKEFYLGLGEDTGAGAIDALILLTSAYRYQNSRYAEGEHKALFEKHIRGAAATVLRHVFLDGGKERYQTVTRRFDAFTGALWAGTNRYEIEVTYYSLTKTDDLKILMTAVIKYAENKLRAYLSVKSRLSVACLPTLYREMIDVYFSHALPSPLKGKAESAARPEYETLYDPLTVGVSVGEAEAIEKSSWENTWLLIPESEKEEILAATCKPPTVEPATEEESSEDALISEEEKIFLSLLCAGRTDAARAHAKGCGSSYLSMGERINEAFCDRMGDVVLELFGEEYQIISDYEQEIREAIAPQT